MLKDYQWGCADMKTEQIDKVRASYGRCLQNNRFMDKFYERFLNSNPEIKVRFQNTDFGKQKQLLSHGLNMMIMFTKGNKIAETVVNRIRDSHNSNNMDIRLDLYRFWKNSLIQTIKECDTLIDNDTVIAWNEVLQIGIDYIVSGYEARKTA